MSDQDSNANVFGEGQTNDSEPKGQIPTELTELVGEGKKYKTMEDALKSIPHAQTHIATLEQELADLKKRQESTQSIEGMLKQMLQAQQGTGQNSNQNPEPPKVDPSAIVNEVLQQLKQSTEQEQMQANLQKANQAMQEQFGDTASTVLKQRAEALGVSVDFLKSTASRSPQAFLELVGVKPKTTQSRQGDVNTLTLNQGQPAPVHKPVMYGASTEDVISAWRRAGEGLTT